MKKIILSLATASSLFIGALSVSADIPAQAQGLETAASHMPVCPPGGPSVIRCHARVVITNAGKPSVSTSPVAYSASQLRTAYNLSGVAPAGQIIAIVDAYDHPSIKSDLDTYSAAMGLATLPSCVGAVKDSAVPCFQKVDQTGGTSYPVANAGWALEIALDVETAHAICGNCSILLVEANSNGLGDLAGAVDEAVILGATAVSNSYGTSGEFAGEDIFDSHYNHPGVAITVSSGDAGYGTSYPSVSPYVTSVGGTTLYLNSNDTYKSESVWSGSGSGCSIYESLKPVGQPNLTGCASRIMADVSAVADPNTGASIYDSVTYNGASGWFRVGGTSLAAPLIAAVYALNGGVATGVQGNSLPYARKTASNVHDIKTGTNGHCAKGAQALCTAGTGFDGPTGLGTPNGSSAF